MSDERGSISHRFLIDKVFKFGTDSTINNRSPEHFNPPPPSTERMITEDGILMVTEALTDYMITE